MQFGYIQIILFAALSFAACSDEGRDVRRDESTPLAQSSPPPAVALDQMDTRQPLPLLPVMAQHQKVSMRDHLLAVQEIVLALANDDFVAIETAAGRIGYSETMGNVCRHMGSGAVGFTDQALEFHHTADTIAAAARDRSRKGVLDALAATLGTCTRCHATFKQQVVDDAAWAQLTSESAPPVTR
jgi:hypothetical protein